MKPISQVLHHFSLFTYTVHSNSLLRAAGVLDGHLVQGECPTSGRGWSPQSTGVEEWLQIDLSEAARLFEIRVIIQTSCGMVQDDHTLHNEYFKNIEVI